MGNKYNVSIMEAETNEFQDTILRDMESRTQTANYHIIGLNDEILISNYPIFPKVFNPNVAKAALFFLQNLGVRKGDVVLDMFTGTGVDSVYAGFKGASLVHAVDISKNAYNNAKHAVEHFNLEEIVKVFHGDLFEPLSLPRTYKKYDLVVVNPPFRNMSTRSESDHALRDPGYKTLKKFWEQVGNYLKDDGRVRSVFSDVGDIAFYEEQMRHNNFEFKVVAKTKYASSIRIHVYEARLK
jgi:methylase of polypeptide subunit release factors